MLLQIEKYFCIYKNQFSCENEKNYDSYCSFFEIVPHFCDFENSDITSDKAHQNL